MENLIILLIGSKFWNFILFRGRQKGRKIKGERGEEGEREAERETPDKKVLGSVGACSECLEVESGTQPKGSTWVAPLHQQEAGTYKVNFKLKYTLTGCWHAIC